MDFPREIGLKRTVCKTMDDFKRYVHLFNGCSSCYTSLYSFKELTAQLYSVKRMRVNYDTAVMDRAWWDFDSKGDMDSVKLEVAELCSRLKGDFRIIATGRGFHVHLLFNKGVSGRNWAYALQRFQRQKARGLNTLDGVGYPEKITRIPDTYNPKRNKWCVVIDHEAFLANPIGYEIPLSPNNSLKSLCPYRGVRRPQEGFDFLSWVKKHPLEEPAQERRIDGLIGGAVDNIPIPPCLDRAIRTDNPPHEIRVALVQHLAENMRWFSDPQTISSDERLEMVGSICSFIETLGWRDYNPHKTRDGVKSCMNYKGAPSCAWFEVRGICPGSCWRDDGSRRK